MTFNDPYYWMEAGGPVFSDWLSAEAAYTRQQIDAVPGREALLAQIQSLDAGEMYVGTVLLAGREWIFSELRPTDPTAKVYRRAVADGTEHVLIDPTQFDVGGQIAHVDYWNVSPDARHIAYGISLGGSEIGTMRIRSLETGADLPEHIDRYSLCLAELDRCHVFSLHTLATTDAWCGTKPHRRAGIPPPLGQ